MALQVLNINNLTFSLCLQGGGTFVFEVKCSDQLLVSPGSSNISKWLPAVSNQLQLH